MKNLLLVLVFFLTFAVQAQIANTEISDRNWYLVEVNIGGVDIEIPNNEELQIVPMDFSDASPHFTTTVCNTLGGNVDRLLNGEDEFIFSNGLGQTLIQCNLQPNFDFENTYFDFFYENVAEVFSFSLTIVDIPPDAFYYLELRVPNGDYVVFSDTNPLSVSEQEKYQFFALPNPVQNELLLKSTQIVNITVEVYDLLGKEVLKTITVSNQQIDVSALKSGMYLGKITTNTGETQTIKFVKN